MKVTLSWNYMRAAHCWPVQNNGRDFIIRLLFVLEKNWKNEERCSQGLNYYDQEARTVPSNFPFIWPIRKRVIRSFTVRPNATKPFPLADGNKIKEPDAAGDVSWRNKNQVQPSNQGRDDIQGWLPHTASSLAPRTQELMRTIDQTGNHESAEPEASGKLSAEPAEKMKGFVVVSK